MPKSQYTFPIIKRDYDCRSFYKSTSDQTIQIRYTQLWEKYISQQEEGKEYDQWR